MSNNSSKESRKEIVYMGNNSTIIMKAYDFSQIPNHIIYNKDISAKAKGIYMIICAECQKANNLLKYKGEIYLVKKWYVASLCKDGEASFETGWKELKEAGYLKQTKDRSEENGKWVYSYVLLEEPETIDSKIEEKEKENPHPENHPLDPHPDFPPLENHGLEQEKNNNKVLYSIVSKDNTPSFEEILEICKSLNSEESAKEVFNDLTKQDFKDNEGKPIANYEAYIQGMLERKAFNEAKKKDRENRKAYIRKQKNKDKNREPDYTIKNRKEPQYEEPVNIDELLKDNKKPEPENTTQESSFIPYVEEELDLSEDSWNRYFK